MVAAPETKAASEVVVSKDVAQNPPSAEELKSKAVEKMETTEELMESSENTEPSGSKEISAENSAKLEKAAEKLSAGKKALLQSQPQQAVDALAEACALQSAVHGDMSNTMCEFYYYYGRALLDLARIEEDVLGNALSGVPDGDDVDNSQVEDPDKLTEEQDKEEESEDADDAEGEEEVADEDTQESQEEEEDVPSLQLAWEVLELAKTIYEKNENLSDEDKPKLSQVYLKLGEVSLENENYPESINMYSECLKLQESILAADDRWLAETHYQLGLAHSLADNFDDAVKHLQSAISVIETRIKNVSAKLEKENIKITEDLDLSELSAEHKAMVCDVRELQKLRPELQEKMTDIKDTKASFTEKLKAMKAHFSGQLSGGSSGKSAFDDGSSVSFSEDNGSKKDAKPISTCLIRKKRKPEDEASPPEDAKKPRTDDEANGVANAPEKQEQKKEKEEEKKEEVAQSKEDEPKEEEKMEVEPSEAKEES